MLSKKLHLWKQYGVECFIQLSLVLLDNGSVGILPFMMVSLVDFVKLVC